MADRTKPLTEWVKDKELYFFSVGWALLLRGSMEQVVVLEEHGPCTACM